MKVFHIFLIQPSHYDDDGYVVQWWRSYVPANSLAVLSGLATDCAKRKTLGSDVSLHVEAIDEFNSVVPVRRMAAALKRDAGGLVGLVGVQSNQFPRAMDLAMQFRRQGIPVVIGGFHVSGCLSMLDEYPAEIQAAIEAGVSIFAGEAEGRFESLLNDAYRNELKPVYDYSQQLPELAGEPLPQMSSRQYRKVLGGTYTIDAGRGCPFRCSFCTIINVQGNASRRRSVEDVISVIRRHAEKGRRRFFITDDNFARNKDWNEIFDRIIALREQEGIQTRFLVQVDASAHRLPRFTEKTARAGGYRIYIGLESLNPDTLKAAQKPQNRIEEYRDMLQAWKREGCVVYAGYIIGFPSDTPESIARDIEIIKRELPIDLLEFLCLTPLPGSEDHRVLLDRGEWCDEDLNKFDLEHVTTRHPSMSASQWQQAYLEAWRRYYCPEHIRTILRRATVTDIPVKSLAFTLAWFDGCISIEGVHPLQSGLFRRKVRSQRRPGLRLPNMPRFLAQRIYQGAVAQIRWGFLLWRYWRLARQVLREQRGEPYTDVALASFNEFDASQLQLFQAYPPNDTPPVRNH